MGVSGQTAYTVPGRSRSPGRRDADVAHSRSSSSAETRTPRVIKSPACASIAFKGRSIPSNMLSRMPGPRVAQSGPPVPVTSSPGRSPVVLFVNLNGGFPVVDADDLADQPVMPDQNHLHHGKAGIPQQGNNRAVNPVNAVCLPLIHTLPLRYCLMVVAAVPPGTLSRKEYGQSADGETRRSDKFVPLELVTGCRAYRPQSVRRRCFLRGAPRDGYRRRSPSGCRTDKGKKGRRSRGSSRTATVYTVPSAGKKAAASVRRSCIHSRYAGVEAKAVIFSSARARTRP